MSHTITRNKGSLLTPWHQVGRVVRAARRRLTVMRTDLSGIEQFVVFIGNPRSGTTLVRSLLNAHPAVLISNELNAVKLVARGLGWNRVLGRLVDNERQFARDPVWTDYNYNVPAAAFDPRSTRVRIIGDKKASDTARQLTEQPELFEQLLDWSPVPVRFVHCVRHPCDVIATRTRRNGQSLQDNVLNYFRCEAAAVTVQEMAGTGNVLRIHQEDLISSPTAVLTQMQQFLGLDDSEGYVGACRSVIYDKPNRSRHTAEWSPAVLMEVQRRAAEFPHLQCYLNGSQITFHEDDHQERRPPDRTVAQTPGPASAGR